MIQQLFVQVRVTATQMFLLFFALQLLEILLSSCLTNVSLKIQHDWLDFVTCEEVHQRARGGELQL